MYIYIHIILKKDDIYSNISYEFEKSPSVKVDQLQSVKRKKKQNYLYDAPVLFQKCFVACVQTLPFLVMVRDSPSPAEHMDKVATSFSKRTLTRAFPALLSSAVD